MKINFTKKEYRILVELLHLGDWMLHAHDAEEKPETGAHRALCQKIYSYFKEMGCEDLIENINGEFYETRKFEDAMQEKVEAYDHESFWEELISRLATRDAEAVVGSEQFRSIDGYDRIKLIHDKEQAWVDEFSEYELARLVVQRKSDA